MEKGCVKSSGRREGERRRGKDLGARVTHRHGDGPTSKAKHPDGGVTAARGGKTSSVVISIQTRVLRGWANPPSPVPPNQQKQSSRRRLYTKKKPPRQE